jgi:8-oxo-dGTP pyrophosphatase MutT (NUDIX family)
MSNKIQRITIKAIIFKNDSFLLVQDHKDKWEMPGGKVDFGESPEDTITRELNEELGVDNVVVDNIVKSWTFSVQHEGDDYQFIVIVYSVDIGDSEVRHSDEHKKYEWVPKDKINSLNMRDGYKDSINEFLAKNK